MVIPAAVGATIFVNDVGVGKFLGSQSFIKKPIVLANVGSTWGLTVVVSGGFSGFGVLSTGFFLQDENVFVPTITIAQPQIKIIFLNILLGI
jgi:hypothetical protein